MEIFGGARKNLDRKCITHINCFIMYINRTVGDILKKLVSHV